ncbi:MAG: hypothetical protein UW79_C0022G0015 [Candidatus Yanofskybacteria bacterium GW2011_GWA2_44_9]|uniref:Vitamin K epoxide reductase domain-containing protein n=1 Tax=Candidatus Yanofskybacteria bacterium GW2011_GWA2_44_9 TaxID=1619025 RepID=A0A0G1KCL4_9BACT|nr:MAG: hypothetical protein UW79_C0022G0015 [Candidatus Yanofskybacteria bacterium GW2011_GWA2_44_9]
MNLNQSLNNQSGGKLWLRVITIVALIGVADTVYLTADRYFGTGVQCFLLEGCEIVLKSPYSEMFSIPLSVFGLLFYGAIFILANIADIYRQRILVQLLFGAGVVGFIFSLYFLYLQLFIIKALCPYCLASLASSTVIFVSAFVLWKRGFGGGSAGVHNSYQITP